MSTRNRIAGPRYAVAAAEPYIVELRETDTVDEATAIIDGYHDLHRTRVEPIPI